MAAWMRRSSGRHQRSFWRVRESSAVRIVVSASPSRPRLDERLCQDTEVVGHPRQVIDVAELLDGPLEVVNRPDEASPCVHASAAR